MRTKIFILTLVVTVITLISSLNIKALSPVNGNYVLLDDVDIYYNSVLQDKKWLLMDDGYWYLDYDGAGSLDNGLFPNSTTGTIIEIRSTSPVYYMLEFYHGLTGQKIIFDLSKLLYIQFSIIYDVANDDFTIVIEDDSNGYLINYTYKIKDAYVRIYDLAYELSQQTDDYRKAYKDGYDQAVIDKNLETQDLIDDVVQAAYNEAYEDAKSLFGYYDNDLAQWLSATTYGSLRYSQGQADANANVIALKGFIPAILGTVFAFFFQVASIGVLGISILDIIGALFGIVILLFVIKMLLGK